MLCRSICCQLWTLELIIFDMVVFRFQPVVRHLEESCQWRWASFTWMHWNFGSSVHNYWIPGLCFNKVLLCFISKSCSCHIYFRTTIAILLNWFWFCNILIQSLCGSVLNRVLNWIESGTGCEYIEDDLYINMLFQYCLLFFSCICFNFHPSLQISKHCPW